MQYTESKLEKVVSFYASWSASKVTETFVIAALRSCLLSNCNSLCSKKILNPVTNISQKKFNTTDANSRNTF